jgi:casein kinase 1 alpha
VLLEVLKHKNLSSKGFPSLESFQITYNYKQSQVVTQDIGPSLSELVQGEPKAMNEASIINIGLQIVNRIEKLHDLGYTHGNICPSTIYFGGRDLKQLFIADFNHSRKFYNDPIWLKSNKLGQFSSGLKNPFKREPCFGDINFASSQSLKRTKTKTRRDDMESIIYVLVYLFRD